MLNRTIFILYNLVYWIPMILPFFGVIDYRTGFIAFFIVLVVRLIFNQYRVNFMPPEHAQSFPLRAP